MQCILNTTPSYMLLLYVTYILTCHGGWPSGPYGTADVGEVGCVLGDGVSVV